MGAGTKRVVPCAQVRARFAVQRGPRARRQVQRPPSRQGTTAPTAPAHTAARPAISLTSASISLAPRSRLDPQSVNWPSACPTGSAPAAGPPSRPLELAAAAAPPPAAASLGPSPCGRCPGWRVEPQHACTCAQPAPSLQGAHQRLHTCAHLKVALARGSLHQVGELLGKVLHGHRCGRADRVGVHLNLPAELADLVLPVRLFDGLYHLVCRLLDRAGHHIG